MTKTEELIEKYKETYLKVRSKPIEVIQKGGWVYIGDNQTAHRAYKLEEYTENLLREHTELKLNAEDDEDDDVRKILSDIRQEGKNIFRSNDLRKMRQTGNRIAKMAKTILNMYDN